MSRLRVPHLIFCVCATIIFVVMAIDARSFHEKARWFPQYVTTAAAVISAATAALAVVAWFRARRKAASATLGVSVPREAAALRDAPDAEPGDCVVLVRGLVWLAVWLGFVFLIMAVGFVPGSLLWLGVWFRTMQRWPFKILVPVLIGFALLLRIAQSHMNVELPGGDLGWIGAYLDR